MKRFLPALFLSVCFTVKASAGTAEFRQVLDKIKQGDAAEAARVLHPLTRQGSRADREKATYLLGQVLVKMGLHQAAAFRFLDLVKLGKGRYYQSSLARLFAAAHEIDSQTFLAFSLEKLVPSRNPVTKTQAFAYRYGEYLVQLRKFAEAVKVLARVSSRYGEYPRAKYLQGLAYAELKQENNAVVAFRQLLKFHSTDAADSYNLNAARVALARVYYQKKEWDKAIDQYREVPKDSDLWHEVLFEMSWSFLRDSRFREALGVLSSLHSAYYEDHFLPESILVRALVYLHICQDDELEKTLSLFRQVYLPMRRRLADYLKSTNKYSQYYEDAAAGVAAIHEGRITDEMRIKAPLPIPIVQTVTRNPEVKRTFRYMQNLRNESQILSKQSPAWRESRLGRETAALLEKRTSFAKKMIGRLLRKHLEIKRRQFAAFFRQYDFISYEMKAAKKRRVRTELADGQQTVKNPPPASVDAGLDRGFFSAKGVEYWPFRGEYWLDEIGNYHFLGKSLCEKKL